MSPIRVGLRPSSLPAWDPEAEIFWEAEGRRIAARNMWISVFTEYIGFCVWSLWSVLMGYPQAPFGAFLACAAVSGIGGGSFASSTTNINFFFPQRQKGRALGWTISRLYIGTFGSFIGYSFALGLVLQNDFGRTPLQAAAWTFIGPLIGSLIRPFGGYLADRVGAGTTGAAA